VGDVAQREIPGYAAAVGGGFVPVEDDAVGGYLGVGHGCRLGRVSLNADVGDDSVLGGRL
jgi:hypothetical protein